jgi:hypothetical protein
MYAHMEAGRNIRNVAGLKILCRPFVPHGILIDIQTIQSRVHVPGHGEPHLRQLKVHTKGGNPLTHTEPQHEQVRAVLRETGEKAIIGA